MSNFKNIYGHLCTIHNVQLQILRQQVNLKLNIFDFSPRLSNFGIGIHRELYKVRKNTM